ncbi:hypothetical protein VQ056_31240 [Paenibacillus sp. JTLBN-2024]
MLREMGRNVHKKRECSSRRTNSIIPFFWKLRPIPFSVAMFRAVGVQGDGSILPGYGGRGILISNPSSAVMAVQAHNGDEDGLNVGWGYQGPTPAGWATLGIRRPDGRHDGQKRV